MKKTSFYLLALLLAACSNQTQKDLDQILALERQTSSLNSDSLLHCYMRFADANAKHDSAAVFLMKAAHIEIVNKHVVPGIKLYERVALEYPNTPIAAQALINGGVAYASIPDPANAKRLYDQFIVQYPCHARIEEVKKWSEYSGLSDEELFRRFQNQLNAQ